MKTIRYNFHSSDTLLSESIRAVSCGNFSHTSIETEQLVYEAHLKHGVRVIHSTQYNFADIKATVPVLVTDEQYAKVLQFLNNQVGKKYDLIGVLSFVWFFLKPKNGQWYCSELAMVSLMKAIGIHKGCYDQKQSPSSFFLTAQMLKIALNL